MGNNKNSLFFKTRFTSFEKLNENFLKAKCYVLALGKNANKSHFAQENVDKAYPSLAYVPVIGHLMCDENGNYFLGGHDVKLDLSTLTLKSQCVPFGVAIPDDKPTYEVVTEEDGTVSTYLTSDVVIWIGRYPELADAFYNEDIFCGQSMEIYYDKSEPLKEDPSYTDIIDFSFDALCMLNKSDDDKFNVNPCFPSASIKPVNFSVDKGEFKSLVDEMKNELTLLFNKNKEDQGGVILDKKNEILQKYNKTIEDLDFSIEKMSDIDFEAKMEELFGEKRVGATAFSVTYNQKHEALRNALDPIIVKDKDGNYIEETYFYVQDFDNEYVFVEKDYWTANDYNCTYGRFTYTFDETSITAVITGEFEEMVKVWLTLDEKAQLDEERANYEIQYSTLAKEFSDYKAEYSIPNSEVNELKEYKANKEAEERQSAEDALFNKYVDVIGETDEFAKLKETASEYELEALEKECLYVVGKYSIINKKEKKEAKNTAALKFSIEHKDADNDDPYGGVIKKYSNK